MKRILSSTGVAAIMAFFVWFTIIFARTHAFTQLMHDPTRTFAILGSFVSAMVLGGCIYKLFFTDEPL